MEPEAKGGSGLADGGRGRERSASDNREVHTANERLRQVIRRLEETNRAQEVFLEISREMLLARDEAQVLDLFARGVRRLLPGRRFLIRILDARSLEVTLQMGEGPHEPREPRTLRLKPGAIAKMRLPESLLQVSHIEVCEEYVPVYDDSEVGLAMPLSAGAELYGLVNLEYPPGAPFRREEDGLQLRPLVNQLSLGLRHLRLLNETLVLKDYLEKLVEGANALIVVLDRSRRVTVFNRELETLTGLRKEEVIGTNFLQLLVAAERPRFIPVLINSMRGVPTNGFETRLQARDGGEIKVAINTASIRNPEGEVEGVIAVGQDLTKIKHLEEQVIHAERLATLGKLAAGVAHELNNPLTSISVYGEYLQKKLSEEGRDPGDLERLAKILDGARRIREFARHLVTYARPPGSDLVLVSVNEVLRQATSLCEPIAKESKAAITLDFDDELPRVYGIPAQLEQVFTNLLTNACHAVHQTGGGGVEVRTDRRGDWVLIFVCDEGLGVPEVLRERIFEPFFTTKPPGQGTGLGLPIVRDIVESHGGRVQVEPRAGRGVVFRVELPVVPVE